MTAPETIFYDGDCGLCHRFVRFVIKRDPDGALFRYAPLEGDTFRDAVPDPADWPDSVIVRSADGEFLVRSRGMFHAMRRLGGVWRPLAVVLGWLPTALCDWSYDLVARIRHRLFARPEASCPVLPPDLRSRFDS